jgi:DNA/RNA endonuclease YhcR with UshA esterase domain
MKVPNLSRIVALIPAVLLLVDSAAFAQQGGRGRSAQAPRYDPSTEITLKGTIEEVKQVSRSGAWTGTHLTLKADQGTFDVHVGPTTYLAKNQMTFAKGDNIEVTGAKVKYGGADAVLAREVKKGDKTLTLRNAAGIPQWSRGRGR